MLKFAIQPMEDQLHYSDHLTFLGSCFSEHIANQAMDKGMHVHANFGTLFHPYAIAKILDWTLDQNITLNNFQKEDVFLSWDLPSTFHAMSENEFDKLLSQYKEALIAGLNSSKYLFITFGSSYVYALNENSSWVANCHKMPNYLFSKELSSVTDMYNVWNTLLEKLKTRHPQLKLVFTISPVRHIKDGLIENNKSKAKLFELLDLLQKKHAVHYFPAYELVIDVLRDYRFYTKDEVHPSEEAIQFVWEHFQSTFFTREMNDQSETMCQLLKAINHTYIHPNASKSKANAAQNIQAYLTFKKENPMINWEGIEKRKP